MSGGDVRRARLQFRGVGASEMAHEHWDEIHGFSSPGEYERFRQWIGEAVQEGYLTEVPVTAPHSGSPMFDEHWYRSTAGDLWRVVAPDPPFRGVFERVS